MHRLHTATLILAVGLAAAPAAAQQHENLERGFVAEKVFQVGDIDSVNLFNGNLILTIPIGGPTPINGSLSFSIGVSYNTAVWDFDYRPNPPYPDWVQAQPNRKCNAGVGWTVSLGTLYAPNTPSYNAGSFWMYVSPDGGEHTFYPTLHESESVTSGYDYTRDGTYLRLKQISSTRREVQFPDGRIHQFDNSTPSGVYKLSKISDPFGNYVNITQLSTVWTITDMHGRTWSVTFRTTTPGVGQLGTIVLPAFNGTTATYTFAYTDTLIHRSYKDDDPETSTTLTVPLLTGITQPDGSYYSFAYYTDSPYDFPVPYTSYGQSFGQDLPGVIRSARLPTGGQITWVLKEVEMPSKCLTAGNLDDDVPSQSLAVAERVFEQWNGSSWSELDR